MLDLPDVFIGAAPEAAHHPLGPSSFDRADLCPGSVALNARLPDEREDPLSPSAQGTRAHALLEHCIKQQENDTSEYIGYSLDGLSPVHVKAAPLFGKTDTEAVQLALDHVQTLLTPGALMYVEKKLDLSIAKPGLFGRGDIAVLQPDAKHLHVVDYKHGAGVRVDVKGNKQLKGYALGWLRLFRNEHAIEKVTCWIIQPRLQPPHEDGPIRSVAYHALDILDWVADLKVIIKRTEDPNAPRIPGKKQCQFCKGAKQLACPEFLKSRDAAKVSPFGEVMAPGAVAQLDMAELGRRLEEAPLLEMYLKNLYERSDSLAQQGTMPIAPDGVPYKWIAGRGGNRAWGADDTKIIEIIRERAGIDITIKSAESPTQAEKLIGKAAFANLCKEYQKVTGTELVTRGPGKPKLVKGDHEKPAIDLTEVRAASKLAAFSEVTTPHS